MRRTLWSVTWPIFIDISLRALFAFMSYWVVSRVSDEAATVLAITNSFILIGFLLVESLAQTSSILIAQNLGVEGAPDISSTYVSAFVLSGTLGLLMSSAFVGASPHLVALFGVDARVAALSGDYLRIVGGGFVVYSLSYSLIYMLSSNGHTVYTLINSLLVNGLGLASGLFIVSRRHGSDASALDILAKSNLIVRLVGFTFLCAASFGVLRNFDRTKVAWPRVRDSLSKILRLGATNAAEVLSSQLYQVVLLRIVATTGAAAVAARSYVVAITGIFEVPALAIARGNPIVLGQAIGAAEIPRARAHLRQAILVTILISAPVIGLGLLRREALLGMFTHESETLAFGRQLITLALLTSFFKGINANLTAALKAAGDVRFCVRLALSCTWCLAMPGVFLAIARWHLGLRAAWLILGVDELTRLLFLVRRWRAGGWRQFKLTPGIDRPAGEGARSEP